MIAIIRAEYLKYKRTFVRKLVVGAPLFFLIIALPQKFLMPAGYLRPWQLLLDQVYNWWPLIFVPLGIALFAALVQLQEKKAGNGRNLRIHHLPPARIWIARIAVMAVHTLLSTLVLIAATLISGFLTAGGSVPWAQIAAGGLLVWLSSLALIPLQLWAAAWKGMFASMALGMAGLLAGVTGAATGYWIYVPWSWPLRLMCPVIGVHPNGVPLDPGSPLLDASVVPVGILVSLLALAGFTWITALWFAKREVR